MMGQAHWLPVLVVLAGMVAIAAFAWFSVRQWRKFKWMTFELQCPGNGEAVDVIVKQDTTSLECVDVERCTSAVLADPDRVTCHKACLNKLHTRRA